MLVVRPPSIGGRVVLVECVPEPAPETWLTNQSAAMRDFAAGLTPTRREQWLLGRMAWQQLWSPLLSEPLAWPWRATARGAPELPPRGLGSLAHKAEAAMAWGGWPEHFALSTPAPWTLGVDLERARPPRQPIAERILIGSELAALPVAEPARGVATKALFTMKEAVYKAIDPWLRRYVGFREACVGLERSTFDPEGVPVGSVSVRVADAPLAIGCEVQRVGPWLCAFAWAHPRAAASDQENP